MHNRLVVFFVLLMVGTSLSQARPLRPNQAFRFHAMIAQGQLQVRWTAAPGYHLYRNRVHLTVLPRSVHLAPYRLPPGRWVNDPAFGHQQVYEGKTTLMLPLSGLRAGLRMQVVARYQGCANAGICYPPITKTVALVVPASGPVLSSSLVRVATTRAPSGVAASLTPPWATLALFLVAGLGLAFTPCVFPMIPILSATIVGQRSGPARPLALSLAYVAGMALTYTLAGVVAALTGHYVQAAFQNPWVITLFSALFVLLAVSMFGLYELQVPARIQERLSRYGQGGQLAGTFVLGTFSALIVGPCVAAPLAGALLLISRTGDAVFGGFALFALSVGMGLPLLVIGTSAGHLLPKAGPWLVRTRGIFGVVLLGVAIWLESRVVPPGLTLALWSLLAIVTAVVAGALEPLPTAATGFTRATKGFAVAVLAYGLVLGIGAVSGATNALYPLKVFTGRESHGPRSRLAFQLIHSQRGLKAVLAHAQGHPIMVDFWASWCVQCQRMESQTFRNRRVQKALSSFVLVRADVTHNDARSRALLAALGAFGPPTMVFFNSQGIRIQDIPGYEGPHAFLKRLRTLHGGAAMAPMPQSAPHGIL